MIPELVLITIYGLLVLALIAFPKRPSKGRE
jgi:hypothetical protein